MNRMRTAEGVLAIIKEQDPNTEVTMFYIRSLIKSGKVPITHVGRKNLVNADRLIEYITDGDAEPVKVVGEGIRSIPDKMRT